MEHDRTNGHFGFRGPQRSGLLTERPNQAPLAYSNVRTFSTLRTRQRPSILVSVKRSSATNDHGIFIHRHLTEREGSYFS